eukprot:1273281-Pleurochrysis_carterae.AAC.2
MSRTEPAKSVGDSSNEAASAAAFSTLCASSKMSTSSLREMLSSRRVFGSISPRCLVTVAQLGVQPLQGEGTCRACASAAGLRDGMSMRRRRRVPGTPLRARCRVDASLLGGHTSAPVRRARTQSADGRSAAARALPAEAASACATRRRCVVAADARLRTPRRLRRCYTRALRRRRKAGRGARLPTSHRRPQRPKQPRHVRPESRKRSSRFGERAWQGFDRTPISASLKCIM